MRRRRRAVLWGARRGDWQIGGAYDRQRQQILRSMARLARQLERTTLGFSALTLAVRGAVKAGQDFSAAMERARKAAA